MTNNKKKNYILLLGIVLIAANLRSPITSVGPLIGIISKDLNLSGGQSGLITTIPLLAFAFTSPLAPKLSRRFGLEKTLFYGLIVLITGMLIRYIPTISTLFLGTLVLGCGISVCNVLLPSLVKSEFSNHSGFATGMYSIGMTFSGALTTAASIPLVENIGLSWNQALSVWAILAIVALISWLPHVKNAIKKETVSITDIEKSDTSLFNSYLAWSVTLFMGIQALIYYVLVTWLPQMLVEQGLSASQAGNMASLQQMVLLPITFISPLIIEKTKDQRLLTGLSSLIFFFGILCLCSTNILVITLSIILIGIGGGLAFSLSMMFFNFRTSTPRKAAELSGMAQSLGYLLAAIGPFLFGVLHDQTHSWTASLVFLLSFTIVLFLVGLKAGSNEVID